MSKEIILITGHTGFIGRALVTELSSCKLRLVGRRSLPGQSGEFFQRQLDAHEDFGACLQGVTVVIHTAAQTHVMGDATATTLAAYKTVNLDATINLARQSAAAGVKRFIFISTIKVNGESTQPSHPFKASDKMMAADAYSQSKADAELALHEIAAASSMEIVIIRPPLVYGPGVKANFDSMLRIAKFNLPLPLGAINNRRSMVALGNLVDLIKTCIYHPNAASQTFLVSDDQDLSTSELLRTMVRAYGKKPRLIPMPQGWLFFIGRITGKQDIIRRLCESLQVDISHTKSILGWSPPLSVEQCIKSCIAKEDLC